MSGDTTDIREVLRLREQAEQRSTRGGRRLLCLGRVSSKGIVVCQAEGGTVFYVGKEPPRSECAWCGLVLREGPGPTSHDICEECRDGHFGGAA